MSADSQAEHGKGSSRRRGSLTLTYRVSLLVAVLLIASALITTLFAVKSVETTVITASEESAKNVQEAVTALIQLEYSNLEDYRDNAMASRKEKLRDVSMALQSSFDGLRDQVDAGSLTKDQAQRIALDISMKLRYGPKNTDYFFVYNRDLVAIGHPDPKFYMRYLGDMQDPDGTYVIRELRDQAYNFGSGFVPYKWVRLGETEPQPKIGYVFHYKPWDWIVGTGVYVDDIDASVATELQNTRQSLIDTFTQLEFGTEGFPFILDGAGLPIVAPSDEDVSWLRTTDQGKALADRMEASAKAAAGDMVSLSAPANIDGEGEQTWLLGATYFEPLKWTIVTAVPYEQLAAPARQLALQQGLLSLVVLLGGLVGGLLLSRRIVRPVAQITAAAQALGRDEFDPASLDKAAKRTDEVGELARVFQRMATDIVERERALRERVAKLTVEIDRTKVDHAVDEIVESDYFTRLKSQADELRQRMKETD